MCIRDRAKKYLVLRDELRGLEISVWLDTLERIRASNIKLEADYQETARQREEARTAQEKAYAAAETYSAQMREQDVEADPLRFEMQGREAQANELESAIAVLKSSIQHNLESAARLKADLEQQEGREGSLSAQIEQRRDVYKRQDHSRSRPPPWGRRRWCRGTLPVRKSHLRWGNSR